MSRMLSARYSMIADFYRPQNTRTEAGQISRGWDKEYPFTVKNLTEAVLVSGVTGVGMNEKWSVDYEPVEYAKMYVQSLKVGNDISDPVIINRRFRVSNIRDRMTQNIIWRDDTNIPTEFNILGISPINDPFGRIVEYEILMRAVISK